MDAETILATAREPGEPPEHWTVIPLDLLTVRKTALGWLGGTVVGLGLFALILVASIGAFNFVIWVLLAVMAFVGLGSAWLLIQKLRQLLDASRHVIVMTPELYVQQVGGRVVSVPMSDISNITLRGVFGGATEIARDTEVPSYGQMMGRVFGGSQVHRRRRTPDSLAFVDARADKVVTIAEDNSYAALPVIEELLRNYVEAARRARTH